MKKLLLKAFVIGLSIVPLSFASTPSDVYSSVELTEQRLDALLAVNNIDVMAITQSFERSASPMHVYQLQLLILNKLHDYEQANGLTPIPLIVAKPANYTPADVLEVANIISRHLAKVQSFSGLIPFQQASQHSGKSPNDVFSLQYEVLQKMVLLTQSTITPNDVFSELERSTLDLQKIVQIYSQQLPNDEFDQKRDLVTSIYGMDVKGAKLEAFEGGKTPSDAFVALLAVRNSLNQVRRLFDLELVEIPTIDSDFKLKPAHVILQTQILLAELNLLKKHLNVDATAPSARTYTDKTPSDVVYEAKKIDYMLKRLTHSKKEK
jgi:hypothetical protein